MLVSGVAAGLLCGWLAHGNIRRLAQLRPRWLPLLILSVALRASALIPVNDEIQRSLYIVALWLLAILAIGNLQLPGTSLIAFGIVLNGLVVTLNGGSMPVLAEAAAEAGYTGVLDPLHSEADDKTFLPFLGDVIPLALFRNVYSAGDVLLAAGVFLLTFRALTRSDEQPR